MGLKLTKEDKGFIQNEFFCENVLTNLQHFSIIKLQQINKRKESKEMSPKYGQPIKEEPRVARVTVNFTVSEKEKLDEYCTKNGTKLSDLCRHEVLKLVKEQKTEEEKTLRILRKEAKRLDYKISKGYLSDRLSNKPIRDENGEKIVGYMITDATNAFVDGVNSTEIFTMNFDELKSFFEQFKK